MEKEKMEKDSGNILHKMREKIFPVKPGDKPAVKFFKDSGFYLVLLMICLISLTVITAITVVL